MGVGWIVPFLALGDTFLKRYHPEPQHCEVGWIVPFLALGDTLLKRYHPESRHCEVGWPITSSLHLAPSLVLGSNLQLG